VALFGGSRRGPAIQDRDALATFMDEQAQAFARGAVENYTRARARQDADTLFDEPDIAGMVEKACAEAYPIALTLIAEMIEGVLAPQAYDRLAQLQGVIAAVQVAFDRRGAPPAVALSAWNAARREVARWLGEVIQYPPKTINEMVEPFAGPMLALMPIHEKLGRDDYALLRDAMRTTLSEIHDKFVKDLNASALAKALTGKT